MNARPLLLTAVLALTAVACGQAASPPSPSAPPAASPSAPPDAPISGGNGGIGVPGDPGPGEPTIVNPVPGVVQVRDVPAQALSAAVNGRRVAVRVEWTSGVEPCYALAGVDVARDGTSFTLTLREGTADPDAACIEIAQLKATIVDLGELEPGTYSISAMGVDDPISVTVS